MTHTEALNLILAHCCPSEKNGDVITFILEGHCMTFEVDAILASTLNTIQYNIVNVRSVG